MPRKPAVHDVVSLDELMTANDVADVLGLSAGTLANWRSLGMGPTYVKLGGRVRYRVSGVNSWVASQEHKSAG
ncbi:MULTISPECIES: helix-turn-helix transcriptional regulator [Micrococcales]|uniref:helix-turn-helix transcriptional regulator n=1 Tax=Micrococcales TaxID=85006 RepID=UPI002655DC81|nr:helix-turn-helix domain-containing protein [Brevibacterium sandarakinum]MDN5658548.1 helix-turn-helix domain-containing protein [Brevibacterium sandarakinum]